MGNYPKYPAYKDSGAVWLGEIPAHWTVRRLKFSVTSLNQKIDADASELPYMGLEHIESWTGRRIEDESASSEGTAARFLPNDILFGKLRPYLAKVHLAKHQGLVSTEALVLRSGNDIDPNYLRYYMVSRDFINNVDSSTYGTKMPRANWEFIGNQPLLIPFREEQLAIARFLDRKTAQIDALIAKKEALLAKLAEKRTALISQAVTRGLDPTAPMKDSGIPWLGEIPAHWQAISLRFLLQDIEQGQTPGSENRLAEPDEWAVLKSGCVNWGIFRDDEHKALMSETSFKTSDEVRPGDILMSRASGSIELTGSVAFVEKTRPRLLLSDKTFRLIPNHRVDARYLVLFMNSRFIRSQIEPTLSGAEGLPNNITKTSIRSLQIVLPPFSEQKQIWSSLASQLNHIDALITKNQEAIKLFQSYRTALITAAVTGKIDVRSLPEALPAIIPEMEAVYA